MSFQDDNILEARRILDQADAVVDLMHEVNDIVGAPATFNSEDVDVAMQTVGHRLVIDSPADVRKRVINLLGGKFDRFMIERRFR